MILSYNAAHVRIQFDYIFHTDGTIEVRVSASGYLQAGFWEPTQEGYGAAIRQTTSEFRFPVDGVATEPNDTQWGHYTTTSSTSKSI